VPGPRLESILGHCERHALLHMAPKWFDHWTTWAGHVLWVCTLNTLSEMNGCVNGLYNWLSFVAGIPPFPQIDVIGAIMIVWRVGGKIVGSVLCNIVCNSCAQCNAHTHEQT